MMKRDPIMSCANSDQDNSNSPTINQLKKLIEIHTMAQMLPYHSYDSTTGLYINQRSIGFMLLLSPLTGADPGIADTFNSLITEKIPAGSFVQLSTWGSPKIAPILDRWVNARGEDPLFKKIALQRADYLKQGAFNSLTGALPFLARSFYCLCCISQPLHSNREAQRQTLIQLRAQCRSSLNNHGLSAQNLPVEGLLSLLSDLLYPNTSTAPSTKSWQTHLSLADHLINRQAHHRVSKNYLTVDNDGETSQIRCLSVDEYPKEWALHGMNSLIGELFNAWQHYPCPFLLSFNFHIQDQRHSLRANLKSDRTAHLANSKLGKWVPLLRETYQDWEYTKQRLAQQDCLVESSFQVVLFTTPDAGVMAENSVKGLFRAKGWRLNNDTYLQLPSYLSVLPMTWAEGLYHDLKRWRRLKTLPSQSATQLLPLFGEPMGMTSPGLLLLGRRGQLFFWDNYDASNENYNVCIVAASGSGKSVLVNEKVMTQLSSGGRAWIIDVGYSYQKICHYLQGSFIEFDHKTHPVINPFSHISDIDESMPTLKPLISLMVRPKTQTSEEEDSFIEEAILAVWQVHGKNSSITRLRDYLKSHQDERANNLAHLLRSYAKGGVYSQFFEGASTLDFDNPLMVLELEALKRKKDLQTVVLWVIMQHIMEVMYLSDRSTAKDIIVDEAWDLLKSDNKSARDFIESISRRARKYKGALITITQGFAEYYANPAANAAWQNAATKILLKQTGEAIDEAKANQQGVSLDPFKERLLKDLKLTEFYSECAIVNNQGFSVGRLLLDPFSLILYSSKGEHVDAVNQLMAAGCDQAVEVVAYLQAHAPAISLSAGVNHMVRALKQGISVKAAIAEINIMKRQ